MDDTPVLEHHEAFHNEPLSDLAHDLVGTLWSCPGFVDGARLARYATTGWRCS
jgi:hypothetical protein